MKKISIPIISILIILIAIFGLYKISKSRTFQFFGNLVNRVETNEKVIALTFDDAPNENSNKIVDILADKGVSATFYAVGQNMESYQQEAKYIVEHGHELGNHSYSHHRFLFKSLSFIDQEIQNTNQLIRESGYQGQITFRPPNGKKLFLLPWYLNKHHIQTIMWDVEPDTYVSGDVEAIINFTLKHTKSGSIILLHPFCQTHCQADRQALPEIITQFQDKGYHFVTVSELLKYQE